MATVAEAIRKVFTTAVKTVDGKDRVLEFIGSTETQDRDGEVIKATAWQVDKYVKNPVVQWAHDYQAPPIGKTLSITRRGTDTIFQIEFADKDTYEFADTIFRLCKGGFLSATSVGFIPLESTPGKKETDARRTFTKVELLEISIVPVPANPDALVTARDAGIISVKEFRTLLRNMANPVSQESIKDEIDYLFTMIKQVGLSPENTLALKRITGSDMPETDKKATAPTIRDIVAPLSKMMADHCQMMADQHDAHTKWHAGCQKALDAIGEMPDAMGEESDVTGDDGDEDKSLSRYLREEIKRQMEVLGNA